MKTRLFVLTPLLLCPPAFAVDDLTLQNISVGSGQVVTHLVNVTIQTASGVTVQSGGELTLTAGSRVTIGPGFHAHSNSRVVLRAGEQYFDADGDGMDNLWEQQNGFSPGNPADAAQDADGDGLSNLAEYRLKTNPRQPHVSDPGGAQTNLKIFVPHK